MPTISKIPFEAHPFTLANMSGIECPQGEATFVIRARDGQSNLSALVDWHSAYVSQIRFHQASDAES